MAQEPKGGWRAACVECRMCGHKSVSAHPAETDEDNLECSNCGHMTAEVVEAGDNGETA